MYFLLSYLGKKVGVILPTRTSDLKKLGELIILEKVNIMYIVPQSTEKCLALRNNERNFSPAAFNKSAGIVSMIRNSGYDVTILSSSVINNKSGKIYKSFHEKCNGCDVYHPFTWDIPIINILTNILWISYILFKKKETYDKILFYNYTPWNAYPAFFAKIILKKKIYLEYEDGYFAIDIFKPLKWLIAINEIIGNILISGAILVTENLKPRVKTENIQIVPGVIDQNLYGNFNTLTQKKDKKKVIMYAGGLDENRGINIFLEVAKEIISEIEGDYEFWVTGKGPLEQKVKDYTKKYPNKIIYHGFVSRNELLNLYSFVDAFVSLQKPEHKFSSGSSPSKVYEFISTGKFCIGFIDLKINSENYIHVKNSEFLKNILKNIINGSYNNPSHKIPINPLIYIFQ